MVSSKLTAFLLLGLLAAVPLSAEEAGSRFVYTQLKYPGNWDPNPDVYGQIYHYLENTTSLNALGERRTVTLSDDKLFVSPFLVISGSSSFPEFSRNEIENLRRYAEGGGVIFIDSPGPGGFSDSADRLIRRTFPDSTYFRIPYEHAVFRSFYLVDYVSGASLNSPYLEGIEVASRVAVIKCSNNLTGIWTRDRMGNFKNSLLPGRPDQRKEAIKLTLNIIMYSVCGTYKNDPVHTPYIQRKLNR